MDKEGYLYVVSNPTHKGWVKIGSTENIENRLHVYQTGDPHRNYKVEYYIKHPDFRNAEKNIKEVMKYFAYEIKNEWYKIDLEFAKSRLDEQLLEE